MEFFVKSKSSQKWWRAYGHGTTKHFKDAWVYSSDSGDGKAALSTAILDKNVIILPVPEGRYTNA